MPPTAYRSKRARLLSERTVTRWIRGPHTSPASRREAALAQRLRAVDGSRGDEYARELEDVCGHHLLEEQTRVLTFVGTLLTRNGQDQLWSTIYRALREDMTDGAEQRFLEDMAAAVREGRRE
jgi:hypothetical protein